MFPLQCSHKAIKTSRSLSSIYWETYRVISPGVNLFSGTPILPHLLAQWEVPKALHLLGLCHTLPLCMRQ